MTIDQQAQAQELAEAVRRTFHTMSATDRKLIQTAVLRAQRKAMAKEINALKRKPND